MKKVYEKPWVHMERFELAEHIASCKFDFQGSTDATSCYATGKLDGFDETIQIFNSGVSGCLLEDDNSCMYTQEDSSATFNS